MDEQPQKSTFFMRLLLVLSALLLVAALGAFWWAAGVAHRTPRAAADQQVSIRIQDHGCDPNTIEVPAGRTTFNLINRSQRAVEWEILDGVMVLEERENIPPGFTQRMTVKLPPGDFQITCGLLSNPHGQLKVTPTAASKSEAARPPLRAFVGALSEYQFYLIDQGSQLQDATKALQQAIAAGDKQQAKAQYAVAHRIYRHVEPIAALFADLDGRINGRADYFERREQDPGFGGFHRIEYGLYGYGADGLASVADQLVKDVDLLVQRLGDVQLTPQQLINASVRLLGRTADNLNGGEEDRYSHSDPANLAGTLEAVRQITDLFAPLLGKADPKLQGSIRARFAALTAQLQPFAQADGYAQVALSQSQRKALSQGLQALASELARQNTTLGLE